MNQHKLLLLLIACFTTIHLIGQDSETIKIIKTKSGNYCKIEFCSPTIIRIRTSATLAFQPSLMEKYGIVKGNWGQTVVQKTEWNDSVSFVTSDVRLNFNKLNGSIQVTQLQFPFNHKELLFQYKNDSLKRSVFASINATYNNNEFQQTIIGDSRTDSSKSEKKATYYADFSICNISLTPDERLYGAGSASRKEIQHRGNLLRIWAQYQHSEAPSPFLMSTDGWGIFNNTTFKNYFDAGRIDKQNLIVCNTVPDFDLYLMVGSTMPEILDQYTTITGKPYILPKWAYGLAFGGNMMENQFDVLNNARHFRQEQIPCDIYWLEPQWMETNYDFSTNKKWNTKMYTPSWFWQGGSDTNPTKYDPMFQGRLKDMGFKLALWLCADQDLSIEEEDRIAAEKNLPLSGKEAWFPHLTKFIDQGISGFKLDPGRTLDEHADRKYFNGSTDLEMHNLNQVLLPKQLLTMFRNHTQLRSFQHYCGGYAGIQHWTAATSGDNGGTKLSLFDILNQSMTGFPNISCDVLEGCLPKGPGIHYGFFLPWVQINSWAWIHHPWFFKASDLQMFRDYAQLRYSLIPYIYSTAINSSLTGMPIVRPMPLVYPDDKKVSNDTKEFMFGENLLVTAFTDSVYLPQGDWIDYWSGKHFAGMQTRKLIIPQNRGGGLFVKAGAILPMQKKVNFIHPDAPDTLIVKVFPGPDSQFELLEDDGISFEYQNDSIVRTMLESRKNGRNHEIVIHPAKGNCKGMPVKRVFILQVYTVNPKKVRVNNEKSVNWKNGKDEGFIEVQVPISMGQGALVQLKF